MSLFPLLTTSNTTHYDLCNLKCQCVNFVVLLGHGCIYLTLSLKMGQFLISGGLSSSLKTLFKTTFLYGLSSWFCAVSHHHLRVDHVSLFYGFVYIVSLSFSQTHGLFVLYVIYFSTCLLFWRQKWGGTILAFYKFKYSTSPSESIG